MSSGVNRVDSASVSIASLTTDSEIELYFFYHCVIKETRNIFGKLFKWYTS